MNKPFLIQKKEFNAIDLGRLFFAVVVVAIHTNPLENCTVEVVNVLFIFISELANPFFFLTTGFFIAKVTKEKNGCYQLVNLLKKQVKMYCMWKLIYMPITVYGYCISDNSVWESIFSFWKYFFFVGNHFGSPQFWFLLALIYATSLIYLLYKYQVSDKMIIVCTLSNSLLGTLLKYLVQNVDGFSGMVEKIIRLYIFIFNTPGLVYGTSFVLIGYLLGKYMRQSSSIWFGVLLVILFGSWILLDNNVTKSFIINIAKIIVFLWIVNFECKWNTSFFRKISSRIYYNHMLIFVILSILLNREIYSFGKTMYFSTLFFSVLYGIVLEGRLKNFSY